MSAAYVRNDYFNWLTSRVGGRTKVASFEKLLWRLHETDFRWKLPMDENRASDGVALRWTYACEMHKEQMYDEIADALDGECSVLEMMVALAIRCEETMDDISVGNRTSQWFWEMIKSLGLGAMHDNRFDSDCVNDILETFLDRKYAPDGRGGLFTIRNCEKDLRKVEIWSQLWWFFESRP